MMRIAEQMIEQLKYNEVKNCEDLIQELREEAGRNSQYFWKAMEASSILLQEARG